jgi:AcrR family transcriptional regulator
MTVRHVLCQDVAKSLRETHVEATREALIDTAIALIERGEPATMRSVAAEAGVAERTIYRYFETRDALADAVRAKVAPRAGVPLPAHASELLEYVRRLFETFDANGGLIVGLTTSSSSREDFKRTRKTNLDAMRALMDAAYPRAPATDRLSAAASLRALLSGSGWVYLRYSCALPNEEVIAAGQWAVEAAFARLSRAGAAKKGR